MESQAVNRLMANQYWQILIRSSLLDIYSIECPPQGRYIAILISRRYHLFQLAIAECCRHFLFVCVSRSTKKTSTMPVCWRGACHTHCCQTAYSLVCDICGRVYASRTCSRHVDAAAVQYSN